MIRRRLDPSLIALAGAIGLPRPMVPGDTLTSPPARNKITGASVAGGQEVAPSEPDRVPVQSLSTLTEPRNQAEFTMAEASVQALVQAPSTRMEAISPAPKKARKSRTAKSASPVRQAATAPVASTLAAPIRAAGGHRQTDEQAAIIAAASSMAPGASLKVIAYAGAGKTSTMRLVASEALPGQRALYMAFNKVIANEARTSFPRWVESRTTHGVAFRAMAMKDHELAQHWGAAQIQSLLPGGWLPTVGETGIKEAHQARYVQAALDVFCQSADVAPGQAQFDRVLDGRVYRIPHREPDPRDVEAVIAHRVGMAKRAAIRGLLERQVPRLWDSLAEFRRNRIQIGHDGYLKLFELDTGLVQRTLGGFRYLIVDEAQDLNPVQRSIAAKAGVSLVIVGDPWQQIYQWRGAEDALEHLPGNLRLHLSQSFRFGAAIADAAWKVLQSKPEGRPTVRLRGSAKVSRIVPADEGAIAPVVLGRTNAGCFRAAVLAAKAKMRVHVVGGIREISEELESAVALFEDRVNDVRHEPLKRFRTWSDLKAEAEATEDVALKRLADEVEKGTAIRDLATLKRFHIDAETAAAVVVSTAHKAKGREWPRVALAEDWPDREALRKRYNAAVEGDRMDDVQSALEAWHVLYVAVTRAIDCLELPANLFGWLG